MTANQKWKERLKAYEFILAMKKIEQGYGLCFDSCECCGGIYIAALADRCFPHTIIDVQDMTIEGILEQIARCKMYISD